MGFYWDDFPYTWFKVANGIQGTMRAITLDRPVLALFYALPMSILGEKSLAWQFFAIITRWLYTLSMYGFLQALWPNRKQSNQQITLLLSVFPGFTQQWISVIYSHAFLIFSLYFLSQIIFIRNLKAKKPSLIKTSFSVILAVVSMTATEYFVGLELLRPLIIFMHERGKDKTKITFDLFKKTFITWLPHLFGLLLFIAYRLFFASSALYKVQNVDNFLLTPISTLWGLITTQIKNIYTSIVPVWGAVLTPFSNTEFSSLYGKIHLTYLGILLIISALFVLLLQAKFITYQENLMDKVSWIKEAIPLSLCILFFSGIPFWAANLIPGIDFPNDRFFLPYMLGSTLVIFIVLEFISKKKWILSIFFCVLFSLSGAYQLYNANIYRNEWDQFTQFFQQLSWRIPSLDNDTILVTDELPFIHYTDNSLTAALNWLYATEPLTNSLPYLLNYTNNRLGTSLPSLNAGTTIHQNYRIFAFDGSTDQMIVFYHQPPGCVHIVYPSLDHLNPLISPILREAANLSNSDLINQTENKNKVFFVEDKTTDSWCYFYQKASLAYQNQNWEEIARLGDMAFNIDDYPNDASERIPFIFGYAYTGQYEKAVQITLTIQQISDLYRPMLCETWKLIEENTPKNHEIQNSLALVENQLACNQPEK